MSFVANQALFLMNQDMLAVSVARPNVHAKVDCFHVDGTEFHECPEGAFQGNQDETIHAPPQHFGALMAAFTSAFPDFDLSTTFPWNFKLVQSPEQAQMNINWAFQTELPDCQGLLMRLWGFLEKAISPACCSIYAYESDRPDAFSENGAVFNMCYFMLNEKANRVVLVNLVEVGDSFEASEDEDDEYACAF